jgi:hypothetical protein
MNDVFADLRVSMHGWGRKPEYAYAPEGCDASVSPPLSKGEGTGKSKHGGNDRAAAGTPPGADGAGSISKPIAAGLIDSILKPQPAAALSQSSWHTERLEVGQSCIWIPCAVGANMQSVCRIRTLAFMGQSQSTNF